jgi:anaerobic magnesium-protoporphyrin IX monomethyl ester cyclase
VDEELLHKLKRAGCYRVSFGVESGNQRVLDGIKKGIILEQAKHAFALAKKAGIETMGFFMLGLPDDTEETMQETIDFAAELQPDIPKVGILMPLPGTPLYQEWVEKGIIKNFNWEEFVFHAPAKVYQHPNLKYETVFRYYNKFYSQLMLNPRFLFQRLIRDIKTGDLPWDIYYFAKTLRYGW